MTICTDKSKCFEVSLASVASQTSRHLLPLFLLPEADALEKGETFRHS